MKLLVVGSQTRAIRGAELLEANGIRAGRQKAAQIGEGCMHAVLVDDGVVPRAVRILEEAGIRVKSIMEHRR